MTSELGKRILLIVAKRGYTGADREAFFHNIRGISYAKLEEEVLSLERGGYINIEWVGPSNFTVLITPEGVELAKSYQEDIWRKDAEALRELNRIKHAEKSIIHEEIGYSKMIEEKIGVEEVGRLSSEIFSKLDEQVITERAESSEGAIPISVGIPVMEEVIDNEPIEMESDMVERRISGEIESDMSDDVEIIAPSVEYSLEEMPIEERIAVDKATSLEKRTKEKRISGDIEGDIPIEKPKRRRRRKKTQASEQMQVEDVPSPLEDLNEDLNPPDFYQRIEDAIAFGESLLEKTENEPITTSMETHCVWEMNRECSILKSRQLGMNVDFTVNHCVVCQLVEIKRLLKK